MANAGELISGATHTTPAVSEIPVPVNTWSHIIAKGRQMGKRIVLAIVSTTAASALFWWLLFKFPEWYLAPRKGLLTWAELQVAENALRTMIVQALGGIALLTGLFFTYRNLKLTQETAANNLKVSQATLRLTEEGKITDRFSKAIDHLGGNKLPLRLGGIYALERIANESDKDYWQVMEVLTAFVRENATSHTLPTPSLDVQTTLTVLGRRSWSEERDKDRRLNLNQVAVRGAKLNKAYLADSEFVQADLRGVNFQGANLQGANFLKADLTGANITGADLSGARNLTAEQVRVTSGYAEAKLPEVIAAALREERKPQQLRGEDSIND